MREKHRAARDANDTGHLQQIKQIPESNYAKHGDQPRMILPKEAKQRETKGGSDHRGDPRESSPTADAEPILSDAGKSDAKLRMKSATEKLNPRENLQQGSQKTRGTTKQSSSPQSAGKLIDDTSNNGRPSLSSAELARTKAELEKLQLEVQLCSQKYYIMDYMMSKLLEPVFTIMKFPRVYHVHYLILACNFFRGSLRTSSIHHSP